MSEILVYHIEANPDEFDYYSQEILKNARVQFCQGKIGEQFIYETLQECDYLFVHKFENDIRGFATIYHYSDNADKTYLYINLICNSIFHSMKTRATKDLRRIGGKAIIERVMQLAQQLGCDYVKLSAIDAVIPYYYKLGFRFLSAPLNSEIESKAAGLVRGLRVAQQQDYSPEIENKMKQIITRYYPGYLSEGTQGMLGKVSGSRIATMQDDGIPMIYDLHATRTGGKKRKTRRNVSNKRKKTIRRKSRKNKKTIRRRK